MAGTLGMEKLMATGRLYYLSFILILFCGGVAHSQDKPAIRAFLVFCNEYPGDYGAINESVTTDSLIVRSLLTDNISEQGWGVSLEITEVSGKTATAEQVMTQFEAFSRKVGTDDTVYIHFSGHGVIKDKATNEQFLHFCDLEMRSRKEWADRIEALPARLKILVTDCCSSYSINDIAEGPIEINPWNSFYFLMRLHEGFVNITAASPGQDAFGTERGGYLTVNLASDMQRYKQWETVFQRTEARVVDETAAEIQAIGDSSLQPQRPFAYGLGKPLFDRRNAEVMVPERVKYIFPDSSNRLLSVSELEAKPLFQLYFGRNEIFARHGFDFGTPLLKFYFGDRFWYEKKPGFKSPNLSSIEEANIEALQRAEKKKGGPFVPANEDLFIIGLSPEELQDYHNRVHGESGRVSGASPLPPPPAGVNANGDIFPYSSDEVISRVAVQNLSLRDLSIARNEIFAKHGFPFKSKALRRHFEQKSYYRRNSNATSPNLSTIEEQNLWLIRKIERLKGGPFKWD